MRRSSGRCRRGLRLAGSSLDGASVSPAISAADAEPPRERILPRARVWPRGCAVAPLRVRTAAGLPPAPAAALPPAVSGARLVATGASAAGAGTGTTAIGSAGAGAGTAATAAAGAVGLGCRRRGVLRSPVAVAAFAVGPRCAGATSMCAPAEASRPAQNATAPQPTRRVRENDRRLFAATTSSVAGSMPVGIACGNDATSAISVRGSGGGESRRTTSTPVFSASVANSVRSRSGGYGLPSVLARVSSTRVLRRRYGGSTSSPAACGASAPPASDDHRRSPRRSLRSSAAAGCGGADDLVGGEGSRLHAKRSAPDIDDVVSARLCPAPPLHRPFVIRQN